MKFASWWIVALTALHVLVNSIDYPGGWKNDEECVNICTSKVSNDDTKQAGKWDYLILEQMYLPQYCRDLEKGIDFTVSHHNVNPYPNGVQCRGDRVMSELTIHGLWPNYFHEGYPSCCYFSDQPVNHPFDPNQIYIMENSLLAKMDQLWRDPTTVNGYDGLCQLYNHEYQKHGICYLQHPSIQNVSKTAILYFQDVLHVNSLLSNATSMIHFWANQHRFPSLENLETLYRYKIQIYCSKSYGFNNLAVIRTCWKNKDDPMDCLEAKETSDLIPCSSKYPISLEEYNLPISSFSKSVKEKQTNLAISLIE